VTTYSIWPFRPFQQHFVEEAEAWWTHCYVRGTAESLLLDSPHWVLIDGEPGSGKTVALHALQRRLSETTFFVPYPPSRWPGASQALLPDKDSHLPQMMASASLALRDYLGSYQEKAARLTPIQHEFLRWLLEKHLGARAFHVLAQRLPPELGEAFRAAPLNNLFNSDTPLEVQGQVDELVCLVQTLGFQKLIFTVDIHAQERGPVITSGIANLFGWLDLMHHPGFSLVAAVPTEILQESNIEARARHRLRRISLEWNEEACRSIAEKHMQQALAEEKACLSEYAVEDVIGSTGRLIEMEYGRPVPAGWVDLAETLLYLTQNLLPPPLQANHVDRVKRAFYARHMPLCLDLPRHGVWRGPRFIALDEQPLNFVELLLRRRGHPINWDDQELRLLAMTKANVHSIASRTRKAIEPIPKQPVYLLNRRGEGGYWLENYVGS
jgi:hypothetical protein